MEKAKQYSIDQLRGAWGAGKFGNKAQHVVKTGDPLIGKFFHSVDEHGRAQMQGQILGLLDIKKYLVQPYDWMMGEPTAQCLIDPSEMTDWLFYDTAEDMRFEYEYGRFSGQHRAAIAKAKGQK